ncbi:glycoside hydrolase family 25 protein [Corynebacterium sp. CCUG 59401]|nr:glycoside hydrolase family 25 protein [Corynebacterium pseudogenitalium]
MMTRSLRPAALFGAVALFATALVAGPVNANTDANFVNGVDVSNHQNTGGETPIDWDSVKGDNQRFAFVKATEGTDFTDKSFHKFAQEAADNGLAVGAYHFARPARDASAQAHHFSNVVNTGPQTALPPVLDLEVDEDLSPEELQDWTRTFMEIVESETGRTPIIYTYRYFWEEKMGDTDEFSNYPLWLAAWQNKAPRPVGGWDKVDIWQRSDNGRISGINTPVDTNLFNGNQGQFARFSAGELDATGGVLEQFQDTEIESEISDSLEVLEKDNTALVAAILGLTAGIVDTQQVEEAAKTFGFDPQDARNIADTARIQLENGELPVEDLNKMMLDSEYSVGDLLILLDNANK